MLRPCGSNNTQCSFWKLDMCKFFGSPLEEAELRPACLAHTGASRKAGGLMLPGVGLYSKIIVIKIVWP